MIDKILEYEPTAVHEVELDCWIIGPCTFKADFGPWKKGEEVNSITFDMVSARVFESDIIGKVLKEATIEVYCIKSTCPDCGALTWAIPCFPCRKREGYSDEG